MTLIIIKAFKITIYYTQHTKNTKLYFQKSNFFKSLFFKNIHSFESASFANFHGPPLAGLIFYSNYTVTLVYETRLCLLWFMTELKANPVVLHEGTKALVRHAEF